MVNSGVRVEPLPENLCTVVHCLGMGAATTTRSERPDRSVVPSLGDCEMIFPASAVEGRRPAFNCHS